LCAYSGQHTSPMLANAIWSTQGELTRGFTGIGSPDSTQYRLTESQAFARWSSDVRGRLYEFALVSDLYFDTTQDTATLFARRGITAPDAQGRFTVQYEPLTTMHRPTYDYDKGTAPNGSPGGEFSEELQTVFDMAALRAERMSEILTQVTLPVSFFAALLNLQRGRFRNTLELLTVAAAYASVVGQRFKHHFRVLRPADRSSLVQPVLLTPQHGAFPAGHATQCHLLKALLAELKPNPGNETLSQLDSLARRIAENRVVAGLHYPVDNLEGEKLAKVLAARMIKLATPPAAPTTAPALPPPPATPLQWLWKRAKAEWAVPASS
ncbi:MAG: hypothetical protein ABIP55_03395, partial [Tepidisphaeraceae bacterium]